MVGSRTKKDFFLIFFGSNLDIYFQFFDWIIYLNNRPSLIFMIYINALLNSIKSFGEIRLIMNKFSLKKCPLPSFII